MVASRTYLYGPESKQAICAPDTDKVFRANQGLNGCTCWSKTSPWKDVEHVEVDEAGALAFIKHELYLRGRMSEQARADYEFDLASRGSDKTARAA